MILKRILNNDKKAALMIIMLAVGLSPCDAQATSMEIGLDHFFEVEEFSFDTSEKATFLPLAGLTDTENPASATTANPANAKAALPADI